MGTLLLKDFIQVKGRFHRAVQLTKDVQSVVGLKEYLVTPTARQLSEQLLLALRQPMGQRAWSITGPYGTGKSAFALFLHDVLCQKKPRHPDALLLRERNGWTGAAMLPILLVGQRISFRQALLYGLAEAIRDVDPNLAKKIKALATQETDTLKIDVVLEQLTQVAESKKYGGILLVVDEFGKFLEYAALNPQSEDLLLVQQIAEFAARSSLPFLVITILHTAFAEYLHTADQTQRLEWQKVQGRFADVTFQEPPEQLLRLIDAALVRSKLPKDIEKAYIARNQRILQTESFREAKRRLADPKLLIQSIPLHPLTALLLWPIIRSKLAQNERSLFAFLTSTEPFGFQEFLKIAVVDKHNPPTFGVDRLYDYVTTALGVSVYTGEHARRWSEIANALDRVDESAPPHSSEIIKAIGLLRLYGQVMGVNASPELLQSVLGDRKAIEKALEYLVERSIIVFRKYDGAYGLWEGSDVNLDEHYEQASSHISDGDLAQRLQSLLELRPIVARRHYIRTGTLRYFEVSLLNGELSTLREALQSAVTQSDGQLIFILTSDVKSQRVLITHALQLTLATSDQQQLRRILAFPKPVIGLDSAVRNLESWYWVCHNTPALLNDPVARREANANMKFAQDQLESLIGQVFGLNGHAFDPITSHWVYAGKQSEPKTAKDFTVWLSGILDEVFNAAPVFRNELLNRGLLSSAATSARRQLMEAMLAQPTRKQLNLTGTPPEVSMYRSLLLQGGFHRRNQAVDTWKFTDPRPEWKPVWAAIIKFLNTTRFGRRPIKELFDLLKSPPFGLREGPLPVLLCALMISKAGQLALYEDGLFVPEIRIEVFERFSRAPEHFEIQEYALAEEELKTLTAIQVVLGDLDVSQAIGEADPLIQVVKDLTIFAARLPAYSKNTRRISPAYAVQMRDALLRARDPYLLINKELPQALGLSVESPTKRENQFVNSLKDAIIGLQHAYPALLDEIEDQTRQAFDLQGTSAEARDKLRSRAIPLDGLVAEKNMSLFVREAIRFGENVDWRVTLGRVLGGGLPPNQWHDPDVTNFQVRMVQLASDFLRLEELAAEKHRTGAGEILRIGILDGHLKEVREVIAMTPERARAVEKLTQQLSTVIKNESLQSKSSEENRRTILGALARLAAQLLEKKG